MSSNNVEEIMNSKDKKHYIAIHDRDKLLELIELHKKDEVHLLEVKKRLENAEIIESSNVPKNIITMHAKVHLKDLDTKENLYYWLVFPGNHNVEGSMVSVLSPIGVQLIGEKEGNIVEIKTPAKNRRLKIIEVICQPEASGNYYL